MKVNFYTLQTPKARWIIGIFCMNMQKIHKRNRLLAPGEDLPDFRGQVEGTGP
jgi:hypothetical protein